MKRIAFAALVLALSGCATVREVRLCGPRALRPGMECLCGPQWVNEKEATVMAFRCVAQPEVASR
jgi:hypothetical protein